MEDCCGVNLEQEMTIENLYCFIRRPCRHCRVPTDMGRRICMSPMWKEGAYKAPER